MNYKYLEKLVEGRFKQTEIAGRLGLSVNGYQKMMANKTMKVSVLEKLPEIFNVPLTNFLTEETLHGGDYQENKKIGIARESDDYREGWNTLIDTNKKSLEALLEMKVELDQCRDKLAESESEVTRLKLIQSSKRK